MEHRAAPVEVPAQEGRTLLLSLVADAHGPPRVEVEVVLEPGDLPMPVAALDPADVVITATALRRLALLSQQQASPDRPVPAE